MSQPLSGLNGGKRPIEADDTASATVIGRKVEYREKGDVNPESEPRSVAARELVVILLVFVGVTCLSAGLAMLWGIGAGLIGLGACVLILGVLIGVL